LKEILMTRLKGLIAVLCGSLALTACNGEDDPNVTTVAVAGPVTGQYASFGTQMTNGGELAVVDINAAGGVLGKKLKLEVGDDACDPKQAVAVANQMAGEGVVLVAGHFCSGSSIPASNVYGESNLVMISPASTNPALTDSRPGPNIYRVCGRDDKQGSVAGAYLAKHFGDKNIAIIDDKTAYGKGLAQEVKKALNAAGVQEVLNESYTAGEKDYSALVSKLKQAAVDVLYVGGYHTEAGLILRQMRDQGMDTVLMGGDALVTQEYWSITGPAGEGTLMTFSPDPRKNPAAAEVVARLKAKGVEPEGYVLYTYAAIQAWKEAAEKAGTTDAAAVVKALNENEFDTVIGKFRFDEKGDPNLPPYAVYRWSNGAYEEIGDEAPAPAG
jgi:branched-chain amino acid transport system substrate-binding protein